MEDKRKQFEQTAIALTANMGFLERNKALADLSGLLKKEVRCGQVFLISMLIILIEVGPVLSKLSSRHIGP